MTDNTITTIRTSLVSAMTAVACGLLFVNVYTSVVDAVSWGSDIPSSIQTARDYFKLGNPGTFFRILSPANQVLSLLVLVVCWKAGKQVRLYGIMTLVVTVALDLFTFAYFFPRNDIMFINPIEGNIDAIRAAWSEWTSMNWVRSGLNLVNVIFDFVVLTLVLKTAK